MSHTKRIAGAAAAGMLTLGMAAAPAMAHDSEPTDLSANITQLNDSGASGEAWVNVDGNTVSVKLHTKGLLEGAPHAQHIHIGGQNMCPSPDATGTGFEGALRTTDAIDQYGAVKVSLTNEPGEITDAAALDVANYPTGDGTYERTFEVTEDIAADLAEGNGSIVLHGVDHDGSGAYDGDIMSDLDPSLPSEATDPAACGELEMAQMDMPDGGAETGGGSTAGTENAGLIGAGAAAAAAGLGMVFFSRRRASETN